MQIVVDSTETIIAVTRIEYQRNFGKYVIVFDTRHSLTNGHEMSQKTQRTRALK